jgi:uncharacterized protein
MIDYHLFAERERQLLFFPRSARLYELSEEAASLLREQARQALFGAPASTDAAASGGNVPGLAAQLVELFRAEKEVAPPSPPETAAADDRNSYQAFSIYLAQSCNMSCSYCWNGGGRFGKKGELMGEKKAGEVTELISSLASESKAEQIFINFYGGEPLLNFPALKRITLELRRQEERLGKRFCFTVDTNGTYLSGKIAHFVAGHFSQVGVSVDGSEEVHDLQRPGKRGEATWRTIVGNVRRFPDKGLLTLRGTLTRHSDTYLQTFRQLATLGVRRIQLEYCHEPGCHDDPSYEELLVPLERQLGELGEFIDDYIACISRYRSMAEVPFLSNLLDNIRRIRRGNRFTRPCGAGMNTLAITSRGEVFPCIAFVEREDFTMGEAGSSGCLSLHDSLSDFDVDRQLPCHTCWLRYDCAGGCYATHYEMSGHTRHPHPEYCNSMRAKGEIHLYALAEILRKCPWHLEGTVPAPSCG